MTTFRALGVPDDLCRALVRNGMDAPFPVQAATLPDGLSGVDLCGRAPTGSGKTLAFGIPLVARIEKAAPHRPTGLVLVPTRELARQVQNALVPLAKARGFWVLSIYGGAPMNVQIQALRRGVDIVVACPGRLQDLVDQGKVDLSEVQIAVVDEADRLADMGFLPSVRKLLDLTPPTRQTMLWSATLDGDVDALIRRYQTDPVRHELAPEPETAGDVAHHFWEVDKVAKVGTAAKLVRAHGSTVVFCRTRHGAERLAERLEASGVRAAAIHGDRTQAQRERALESFRRGQVSALVATDVAARGIHVDDVALVVHWDPPADPKDYVHRSGRTGRAGATGTVVTLVTPDVRKATAALQRHLDLPAGLMRPDPTMLASFNQAPPIRKELPGRGGHDERPTRAPQPQRPRRSQMRRGSRPSPKP